MLVPSSGVLLSHPGRWKWPAYVANQARLEVIDSVLI